MIDWIHARCNTWGRQIRWLYQGKDGWPSRSTLGKMIEEGLVGASADKFTQHWPEVLNADALEINNAVKRLAEPDREMLFVHYVVIGKGKVKAARIGISRSTYYDRLDLAQQHLWRALAAGPDKIGGFCPGQMDPKYGTLQVA